jgi:tRNA-dihydrouridine synthase
MDGISDHPFRHIQKKYGNPVLVYTEFTSVEMLCLGDARLLRHFLYDETQRPIIGQIYGRTPHYFYQAAILLCELGFDGIDINMGCPARTVAQTGSGAALIQTPQLAQEIVRATQQGVRDWVNGATVRDCPDISPATAARVRARHERLPAAYRAPRAIPVSVKTRIGYDKPVVAEWVSALLETEPVAIGLHGRTLKQSYRGAADWDAIGCAAELTRSTDTLLLGNGDVASAHDVHWRADAYGVDGALIGRASYGNPFVFHNGTREERHPAANDRMHVLTEIALEHSFLYERTFQHEEKYHFLPMRKHLGWYARGISGEPELRARLLQTHSPVEVAQLLRAHAAAGSPVGPRPGDG